MPTTDQLAGYTILVTRPEHQAEPLCRLIEDAGGIALRLPVITIHDSSSTPAMAEQLIHLNDYDLAIFISPNAVRFGSAALKLAGGIPQRLQLAVIGASSARTLNELTGRTADLAPTERFDSEGLLTLEPLQQLTGKKVIIFRGNGGRELLAETLRQRGAQVDYAEVYRRDCPAMVMANDERLDKTDIIVVTSREGVTNLVSMTPPSRHKNLFNTPLLLVSGQSAQQAQKLGFQSEPVISPQATDQAIIDTLTVWAQRRSSTTTEE